jgi:hypothetical protein
MAEYNDVTCRYFEKPGPKNTEAVLEAVSRRAKELGIKKVVVATQELPEDVRQELISKGITVLTCQHAFGGIGRAVRNKLSTYQVNEIIAYTLRTFGQGTKVAIELSMMAADAGLIRTDEDVISVGGTGKGSDSALLLRPVNSFNFFDLKVKEIICKPAVG